jgi:hypothetical protein
LASVWVTVLESGWALASASVWVTASESACRLAME